MMVFVMTLNGGQTAPAPQDSQETGGINTYITVH